MLHAIRSNPHSVKRLQKNCRASTTPDDNCLIFLRWPTPESPAGNTDSCEDRSLWRKWAPSRSLNPRLLTPENRLTGNDPSRGSLVKEVSVLPAISTLKASCWRKLSARRAVESIADEWLFLCLTRGPTTSKFIQPEILHR